MVPSLAFSSRPPPKRTRKRERAKTRSPNDSIRKPGNEETGIHVFLDCLELPFPAVSRFRSFAFSRSLSLPTSPRELAYVHKPAGDGRCCCHGGADQVGAAAAALAPFEVAVAG